MTFRLERTADGEWRLVAWRPEARFKTFCAFVVWARKQRRAGAA
jgi:hypothetical protein